MSRTSTSGGRGRQTGHGFSLAALAAIDTTVGDVAGNAKLVALHAAEARLAGASIAIFPELTLTGYPPKDLLDLPDFHREVAARLAGLARIARGIDLVVGGTEQRKSPVGKSLYNSAFYLSNGRVAAVYRKRLLPTYDVFDEGRHFEPGSGAVVVRSPIGRVGLTICEDAWNDKFLWKRRLYEDQPVDDAVKAGAEVIVNIAASPYELGKRPFRRRLLGALAKRLHRPLLSVNLVGGNDELLFDGGGAAFDAGGALVASTEPFESGLLLVSPGDLSPGRLPPLPKFPDGTAEEIEIVWKALVIGIRDYAKKCGFRSAVLGLSGGIDSALTAAIAVEALGAQNVIGVSLPGPYSSEGSLVDAAALAANLGIDRRIIPISPAFESLKGTLAREFEGRPEDVTEENLQSRIRGVILMSLSNKFGHLLLTTGNKSELAVGYCTLYGDMCGGLGVISDVPKTMVYRLALHANRNRELIPRASIEKPPSAELRAGQTDQDTLPDYDLLDRVLERLVERQESSEKIARSLGLSLDLVRRIAGLFGRSEYKRRQAAPGLRITSKAFGIGRRYPIAQGYRR